MNGWLLPEKRVACLPLSGSLENSALVTSYSVHRAEENRIYLATFHFSFFQEFMLEVAWV